MLVESRRKPQEVQFNAKKRAMLHIMRKGSERGGCWEEEECGKNRYQGILRGDVKGDTSMG